MKKLLLASLFLCWGVASFAQAPDEEGSKQLNVGFGFTGRGIPVFLGLEYAIADNITVGGELSYRAYTENYHWSSASGAGVWKYDHSVIGVLGRGDYHFNNVFALPQEWDVYGGLHLGYYAWNTDTDNGDLNFYDGQGGSGVAFGVQLGGRYYFTEKLAANLEIQANSIISTGKAGISFLF